MELFRTGLIRIHIYFTSSNSARQQPIKRGSSGSTRYDSIPKSLPPLQTVFGAAQERYSEDDDDQGEHEELLSPLDRPAGSSSLISLTSISSPPSSPRPIFVGRTAASAIERSEDSQEQGDAIIGPNNIHHGRPDFASVFEATSDRLARDREGARLIKVGVFYCGSPSLGRTLARECGRCSKSRIKFVYSAN